jgi:hypothetical protein
MNTQMDDITQQFQLYRETARHLWNSCFARRPDILSASENFDRICEELFDALVLSKTGNNELPSQLNVQGFRSIRVVPLIAEGTPILINRTTPSGPYWDDPMRMVTPDGIALYFIGFFDWDSDGIIDMRYLRVCISAFDSNRLIEGREALIEISHAKVVALHLGRNPPAPSA